LDEISIALEQRSLCLHASPANAHLLVSAVRVRPRFNFALSVVRQDRESLARYTVRDLAEIVKQLERVKSRLNEGPARIQLVTALSHVRLLSKVHETVLAGRGSDSENAVHHRITGDLTQFDQVDSSASRVTHAPA